MSISPAEYWPTPAMPQWNGNPLVEALGRFRSEVELQTVLKQNPYAGRHLSTLPYELLDVEISRLTNEAFVVTSRELGMASVLQRTIWNSLAHRPPTGPGLQRHALRLSRYLGSDIEALPWSSNWADCGKIGEVTGLGKTHNPKRILALWPQAIRHPKLNGVWETWLQLVYLHLDMSFDGNLPSLLLHILREMDRVFDWTTSYAIDLPKRARNVGQLQVWVLDALVRHFTGLLVLDELQAISLLLGRDRRQVANFFLRLLNAGIPVIFAGNPFAFEMFDETSQLSDRLNAVVLPELLPSGYTDQDAKDKFFPEIWAMQVMPVIELPGDAERRAVFECSAWHPRHIVRALQNGQRVALAKGATKLSAVHIYSGFEHLANPSVRRRIQGFARQRPMELLEWNDIPILALAKKWGIEDETTKAVAQEHDLRAASRQGADSDDTSGAKPRKGKAGPPKRLTMADVAAANRRKLAGAVAKSKARAKRQSEARARAKATDGTGNPLAHVLVKEFDKMNSAGKANGPSGFDLTPPP